MLTSINDISKVRGPFPMMKSQSHVLHHYRMAPLIHILGVKLDHRGLKVPDFHSYN